MREELIQKGGFFAELVERQRLDRGDEPDAAEKPAEESAAEEGGAYGDEPEGCAEGGAYGEEPEGCAEGGAYGEEPEGCAEGGAYEDGEAGEDPYETGDAH